METRSALLENLAQALRNGTVTEKDVLALLNKSPSTAPAQTENSVPSRLSAVDIMFYIAGIVLFAGLAVLIAQSWEAGPLVRILLSAGIGSAFWAYAYILLGSKYQNDVRGGLINALLLTGSLLLIAGGFITANEFISFETFHFYASAIVLLFLGGFHIAFGLRLRKNLILLMGIILSVAAFPSLAFGLLEGSGAPIYVWSIITAIGGGLLAYAARVVAKMSTNHKNIMHSFDPLGAFIALMSLYAASFDNTIGLLWLLALITGIVGLFYLSIVMQNKLMLGNGSFFLVLSIITISFRYFSGYGAAASLLVSAAGLLATAVVATTINRRYLKPS
jgi:hypothetical protein